MFGENWRDCFESLRYEGVHGAELNRMATEAACLCGRYGWFPHEACGHVLGRAVI